MAVFGIRWQCGCYRGSSWAWACSSKPDKCWFGFTCMRRRRRVVVDVNRGQIRRANCGFHSNFRNLLCRDTRVAVCILRFLGGIEVRGSCVHFCAYTFPCSNRCSHAAIFVRCKLGRGLLLQRPLGLHLQGGTCIITTRAGTMMFDLVLDCRCKGYRRHHLQRGAHRLSAVAPIPQFCSCSALGPWIDVAGPPRASPPVWYNIPC